MNKILLLLLITIYGCQNQEFHNSNSIVLSQLEQLKSNNNYFKMRSFFDANQNDLSEKDVLYYRVIINNYFIRPKESNQAIDRIISDESISLPDSLLQNLYLIKKMNHSNLFEYKEAAETTTILLQKLTHSLDSTLAADLRNTYKMDFSLKDVPKQEVIRNSDINLSLERDIAHLLNIPVRFKDTTSNFIFDTGANMSVIRRSYVKKMGLQLIESDFLVNAATGMKVKSDLAVADELNIGGLTFKNVVFLVFDDKDLSFPGYNIYGIIGFPVIRAMKEIQIDKNNNLHVPKMPNKYFSNNLALDGLTPIIQGYHKSDTLIFQFDTGAKITALYPKFYDQNKDEIESNFEKKTFSFSSAGGEATFDGYEINDFEFRIGESEAELNSLKLNIEKIGDKKNEYHGNLGQDFIQQFDKMILSFEHASIIFQ